MKHTIVRTILLIALIIFTTGARLYKEAEYQKLWCTGKIEFVLKDRTRVDCLQKGYVIEFDFANKWAEAIGQSLHYGLMTSHTPGIVLIMEKDSDWKYWKTLNRVNNTYNLGIELWVVGPTIFEKE